MYKKYAFPIQIFLILEQLNVNVFTTKKQKLNNFYIFLNYKFNKTISYILKNELFLNNLILIENSAIDLKYYNNTFLHSNLFYKKHNFLLFYNFIIFNIKVNLTFFFFLPNNFKYKINSLDMIFLNANWIERETSEMYGIFFNNKKDQRKLLLDYSSFDNPLKKNFPLEGYKQVFFSFFENQVITKNIYFVEI